MLPYNIPINCVLPASTLTINQWEALIQTQLDTNFAYFGKDWREKFPLLSIRCSIFREWSEMLDEVETSWHCYKPEPNFNKADAVYELVDIVHFGISAVIHGCKDPFDALAVEATLTPLVYSHKLGQFSLVENYFTQFMVIGDLTRLSAFITAACAYFDISLETYLKAHQRKNNRNRARAAAGVINGTYDKSQELPLTLEF